MIKYFLAFFIFIQILKEHSVSQNVASDLGLHCLRTYHKKEARLIWLKPKKCEPNRTAFEIL